MRKPPAPRPFHTVHAPWVKPCSVCKGINFDVHVKKYADGSPRIGRYCVPCKKRARQQKAEARK